MTTRDARDSERGAILVFVAIAILMLTAFLVFVLDFGIMWIGRNQAQNAADAGALAGAIARAYDDLDSPPADDGPAAESAEQGAEQNDIWGAAGVAQVSWTCPTGVAGSCVRVDVYRNGQFGSTSMPTVFGPVLGITSQGVRATATARVATGNATNCMRPFSVPDKWIESYAPASRFNRWKSVGPNAVLESPNPDQYEPPSATSAGSGYRLPDDFGAELTLKHGNPSNSEPIEPGWTLPVRLPDGEGGYVSGANDFSNAIANCIGHPVRIGQYLPLENGVMVGPARDGVEELIAQDPNAGWNGEEVEDSCVPACAPISPRTVPITVFDMDEFQWRREANNWTSAWGPYPSNPCPTGGKCIRVTNILGFFVDRMAGNDVIGYLMTYPGEFVLGAPAVGGGAAFLQVIQLVR